MASAADGGGMAGEAGAAGHRARIARLVRGTNINEQTLLATDYLNHFNEIIMILEILPDMPDCLEDAQSWAPKSYAEHFRDSGLSDRELAVAAYDHCPQRYRAPFDRTVEQMNRLVERGLVQLDAARQAGEEEVFALSARTLSGNLQRLMDIAAAVIHGSEPTIEQAEIDRIMAL
jgi:hypothetical protein